MYERPSVLGWVLGLGTDTTEEQELSGKRVALSGDLSYLLGAQVQERHPPVTTLLPAWVRARGGGASLPGQDPELSGPGPQRSLLDSDLLLPQFTPRPPGRAPSHLQEGHSDVTAQGSRMSPLHGVWGLSLMFPSEFDFRTFNAMLINK